MNRRYEYVTLLLTLVNGTKSVEKDVRLPDGHCIAISTVTKKNTDDEIIDLAVAEGSSVVIKPADVRFSEKTNGGNFVESLRPVDLDGGKTMTVSLTGLTSVRTDTVTVQVLFMVQKPVTIDTTC